jgi:hypothetical protein
MELSDVEKDEIEKLLAEVVAKQFMSEKDGIADIVEIKPAKDFVQRLVRVLT